MYKLISNYCDDLGWPKDSDDSEFQYTNGSFSTLPEMKKFYKWLIQIYWGLKKNSHAREISSMFDESEGERALSFGGMGKSNCEQRSLLEVMEEIEDVKTNTTLPNERTQYMGMVAISRRRKRRKGNSGKNEKRKEDQGSSVSGENDDEGRSFGDVDDGENMGVSHRSSVIKEDDTQVNNESDDHSSQDEKYNEDEDEDDFQIEKPRIKIHNGLASFESPSTSSRNGFELEKAYDGDESY
ncbi:hypothetical protein ACHAO1_011187, partial [Botrytis cinerea]